ncbi:hypothetical protein SAMN05216266_101237 [Amycolatopsis marina]|uniref:Uncharacterized protein n=1 Tax=Amycolatopsis marina TaxID=490629 RepID=A0A1I0VGK4_9PSEU|nr:hypothetical protein [Amycolatopsis marina]SFA75504.1 hypothetical protein SAMN05216266_101237 [Amycolatopsis marina]
MTSSRDAVQAVETEKTLRRLIDRGYRFVHPRDADGEVLAVVGVRAHGTVIDVVRLEAEDDVLAIRMPADEADILEPRTQLWRSTGEMCSVIDELLSLGDKEYAPGSADTRGCWVPGEAGRAKWLMASA